MQEIDSEKEGRLQERVAIVTGGASGIGLATCLALAREGANLVIVDSHGDNLSKASAEIASRQERVPLALELDVRNERQLEDMVVQTLSAFSRIDVLITCAGILRIKGTPPKPMSALTLEDWDAVMDTNLKGVFLSNRAVLPTMIARRRGHIVNLSSTSGRQGRAFDSAYCASKFGVIGLSEALAEEVRQYRIKVEVVLPDAVDTPFWEQNGPIPRPSSMLDPAQVAELIVYMLTLPEDTVLLNPVIAPVPIRRRTVSHSRATRAEEPTASD